MVLAVVCSLRVARAMQWQEPCRMTTLKTKAEATALAERMGGAAPVAMICLDPQATLHEDRSQHPAIGVGPFIGTFETSFNFETFQLLHLIVWK